MWASCRPDTLHFPRVGDSGASGCGRDRTWWVDGNRAAGIRSSSDLRFTALCRCRRPRLCRARTSGRGSRCRTRGDRRGCGSTGWICHARRSGRRSPGRRDPARSGGRLPGCRCRARGVPRTPSHLIRPQTSWTAVLCSNCVECSPGTRNLGIGSEPTLNHLRSWWSPCGAAKPAAFPRCRFQITTPPEKESCEQEEVHRRRGRPRPGSHTDGHRAAANAEPVANGPVIVGSDTLQDVMNALTNGTNVTGSPVRSTAGSSAVASFDATVP